MLTQNQIKYYSSLLHKKYRQEYKKFLVEGSVLINEALNWDYNCEVIIASTLYSEKNNSEIQNLLRKGLKVEVVKQNQFEKLCDTKSPQGIVGVFQLRNKEFKIENVTKEKFIVALENISDPGNLGTIIRNCDWFGVKNILLSPDCAEIYNPKVIRASAGSVFHIDIYELNNFYEILKVIKNYGYIILCTDLKGINIYEYKLKNNSVIVFSNEANGPTENLQHISDQKITIPRFGNAESLNVASASAVVLSEISKKYL